MKLRILIVVLFLCSFSCKTDKADTINSGTEMVFDKEKWNNKDGADYPYRDKMLNDIVYNDTLRSLNKSEVLELLGEPSYYRDNKIFLYYEISQKRLGFIPLHTKTMVIKLTENNTIEWIKVHE